MVVQSLEDLRDFVTGSYLLTKDGYNTNSSRRIFKPCNAWWLYTDQLPKPATKGKDGPALYWKTTILIIPSKRLQLCHYLKMVQRNKGLTKDVVIKNGELISGVIDKSSIGAEEPESVLHRIAKDYGNATRKKFLKLYSNYGKTIHHSLWIQLWLW